MGARFVTERASPTSDRLPCWEAALQARLSSDLLSFDRIAELHAVEALGAVEPEDGHASNRRGFDLLFDGRKVEVKSKTPSHRARSLSASYVIITPTKTDVAELFWFYLFHEVVDGLEVFELTTQQVLSALKPKGRTRMILVSDIQRGRKIWGEPPAHGE